ncbi:MAG: SDR family oxidoreductase [Candidatus Aminicenantes bacterium]|nr:SDR family oxidoreductase [Candidatus Aminicenantes bacterium]MDH5385020.1 SDR family oxidoreductase [Candidatus Aminicenantes bacterium]MDH5745201.1 SDR family oxidoreductase [Candidatus Aminicenantes bacterium]
MEGLSAGVEGRVAVVTGAGRGMGRAISFKLSEAGARVVVGDIDRVNAEETAIFLKEHKGSSIACTVDVSDERSVASMVTKALESFGQVDILVNNAGIMYRTRIMDISAEEWDQVIRVNLTGPFLCTRAVLPVMKKKKFGRIVNISSSAGRSVSTLGGAHYTASKAGLLGLTRAVAKEVAPFGITANAVCPGLIDTEMVRKTTSQKELTDFLDSFPIKRIGTPEEVGELVVFLCSDKASYITGVSLDINGGDLMI